MATGSGEKFNKINTYKERVRKAIIKKGSRCPKNTSYREYYKAVDNIKKIEDPVITYENDDDLPILIDNWLAPANHNAKYLYYNNSSMTTLSNEELQHLYDMSLREATNAYYAFAVCDNLRTLPEKIELPKVTDATYMFYDSDYLTPSTYQNRLVDISLLTIIDPSEYTSSNINSLISTMNSYWGEGQKNTEESDLNAYIVSKDEYDSENNTLTFRFADSTGSSTYLTAANYPCTQEFAETLVPGTTIHIKGYLERTLLSQTTIELAPGCSCNYMFHYCRYMPTSPIIEINNNIDSTYNDCSYMFRHCWYLLSVGDTFKHGLKPTSMSYCFGNTALCFNSQMMQKTINSIDLSQVSSMNYCFEVQQSSYSSIKGYSRSPKYFDIELIFPENHYNNKNVSLNYMFSNRNYISGVEHIWNRFYSNTYGSCDNIFNESYHNYDPISNPSYYVLKEMNEFNLPYTTSVSNAFYYCGKLQTVGNMIFGPRLTNMQYMFYYCRRLKTVGNITFTESPSYFYTDYMFYNCTSLEEVGEFDMSSCTSTGNMFYNCTSLKKLGLYNIKYNLDIHWSTLFTREALLEIIDSLWDYSGTDTWRTLTIGSENKAKLLEEDIAEATNKNWTLA